MIGGTNGGEGAQASHTIVGGAGDDTIYGGPGPQTIDAGSGELGDLAAIGGEVRATIVGDLEERAACHGVTMR